MRRVDVLPVASECGLILFACSATLGIAQVHRLGAVHSLDYLVATGVPASAALGFLVVAFLVPGFLAPGAVRYPVNLIAPMVYSALLIASWVLWSTNGSSIKAIPDSMRPIEVWGAPIIIVLSAIVQVVVLTLVGRLARPAAAPHDSGL
jgi:hypothetical protein